MPLFPEPDTIAAISTPPGRGAIGIVRLSGPQALSMSQRLWRLPRLPEHARARFIRIPDPECTLEPAPVIDEGILTAFHGPNSYTGEDVVELAVHGAPVVLEAILSGLLAHGARLAEPGEFTQRAFLAGRLDLTQAEAVHDLIAARTLEQARAAAQQLGGALSRRLGPAKARLMELIVRLEAGMDFAAGELDDVDIVSTSHTATVLLIIRQNLEELVRSFAGGALLRSGVALALVGPPNAGKSSLFNALLARPRAIVTPIPGTTRDTLEETWSLGGIPVRLVDTAGLRPEADVNVDEAEQQGMQRSREALADADVILLVHDATLPKTDEESALAAGLDGRPYLLVRNKSDLLQDHPARTEPPASPEIAVSALTGQGLNDLRSAILGLLSAGGGLPEAGALNNRRQQQDVLAALEAVTAASRANSDKLPHELLLVDLHAALAALDSLTGQTTADDILAGIFSAFCIGK